MLRFFEIRWGAAFGNVLTLEFPAHVPLGREEWVGERERAPSGIVDVWRNARHEVLEFELRYIPTNDAGGATGWYGATGVRAFLADARDGGTFQLLTDRADEGSLHTCQLLEADEGRDGKGPFWRLRMKVQDTTATAFEV